MDAWNVRMYFHSFMSYGIFFWKNLSDTKRKLAEQSKAPEGKSYRELFSKLSVKLYSFILLFVVGNMEELQTNSDIQVMYKA
jgi:hypothetical protein